jgi:hypothetical protein
LVHAGVIATMVLTMSSDSAEPTASAPTATSAPTTTTTTTTADSAESTPLLSKAWSEREGDGTRGKTIEEITEAYKDKLSEGELKKLIEQVQKLRGERNKNKDSRKK